MNETHVTLQKAIAALDEGIPTPANQKVDPDHLPITTAWQECKKALLSYEDMQDRHDTLMRRWAMMVETIRKKIDAGVLTADDRQLLNDLNLPHRYDKRTNTLRDSYGPLSLNELREMDGQGVWCETLQCDGIVSVDADGIWADVPFLIFRIQSVNFTYNIEDKGLTVYRHRPKP